MRFAVRAPLASALLLILAACGSTSEPELQYVEQPVELLYNQGYEAMEVRNYTEAAQYFDEVERQHPFSEWARRSMLMAAFANYQARKYDEAISDAERFIALHPGNSSAPYAYYLIALSHFERIYDVGRDQSTTRNALEALNQVVRRFPDTAYAKDARVKIDMTNDHLAGKEMTVGRWYMRNGYYLAAINRYKNVLRDYSTTNHVPEALHRLVESYVALGIDTEARQVAAVLGYNYPGSEWYEDSYDLLTARGIAIPGAEDLERDPSLLRRALDHSRFRAGDVSTHFIEAEQDALVPEGLAPELYALGAAALMAAERKKGPAGDPWSRAGGFRVNGPAALIAAFDRDGERLEVRIEPGEGASARVSAGEAGMTFDALDLRAPGPGVIAARKDGEGYRAVCEPMAGGLLVSLRGQTALLSPFNAEAAAEGLDAGAAVKAPMPGKVLSVNVAEGDSVTKGQTLAVLEAMKMEQSLAAPRDGVVAEVRCTPGGQVGAGDILIALAEEGEA